MSSNGALIRALESGSKLRAVTPSDSTRLDCRALYVGTGGDLVVTGADDKNAVTLVNVQAGSLLPIACKYVNAATTADDIIAIL